MIKSKTNRYHNADLSVDQLDADVLASQLFLCQPVGCTGRELFKWEYLKSELLSKLCRPDTYPEELRVENAILKLKESEENCARINHSGYGESTPCHFFNGVMLLAQRKIADILGDLDVGALLLNYGSFSSGASTTRTRKKGDSYYKYVSRWALDVTSTCWPYADALIQSTPLWEANGLARQNMTTVVGNRIDTVPKKTEVDRAIAIEPDMNMYCQRSVGTHIRKQLRLSGVNLNDQSRNGRLARQGSIDGSLATIDLKSASDSLTVRLVMELLPSNWFGFLDDIRSHYGRLPSGELIRWEKFSSMGNGFTFELESLIFFALAHSVCTLTGVSTENLGVYGDDIIVPTCVARNLISVLSDVGFETNESKTFISGSFRESCGKHYYEGYDVTPFYIRKPIDSLSRVIWFLNRLRCWSNTNGVCDPSVQPLWLSVRRGFVPSNLLGGKDLSSVTSVASPHFARKKLAFCTISREIDGVPAVLRSFQLCGNALTGNFLEWRDIERERLLEFRTLQRQERAYNWNENGTHTNLVFKRKSGSKVKSSTFLTSLDPKKINLVKFVSNEPLQIGLYCEPIPLFPNEI